MVDLEQLSQELHSQFDADAAQHALLHVVMKGWHLNEGENQVRRYAKKCAKVFQLSWDRADRMGRVARERLVGDDQLALRAPKVSPPQLNRLIAQEALEPLREETILMGLGFTQKEVAEVLCEPQGTVKSRTSRDREGRDG